MANVTAGSDADCTLRELEPTTNFDGGLNDLHWLGAETKELEADICIRIDFSAELAADATVDAAALFLSVNPYYDPDPPSSFAWYVRRCLQSWVVSEATFNVYSTGNNWGAGGARLSTTDYTNTDQATPAARDTQGSWEIDVTALVVDAQANRNQIFDVVLHGPPGVVYEGDFCYYRVAGYKVAGTPYLSIDYTPAAGGSRNRGYILGSRLGLPSLPRGWRRRPNLQGLIVPVGC